jgi:transposase
MLHFRVVKTKGNSRSVQVYRYENGKRVIVKHIGSTVQEHEVSMLLEMARVYIYDCTKQIQLFEEFKPKEDAVSLDQCDFIGVYYSYFYDVIRAIQNQIGYTLHADNLLNDLVVMRIFEPGSKLRSIELMKVYFGINHRRQRFYDSAKHWLSLKERIEKQTLKFAKAQYSIDFCLLFYDVTTLYFETFTEDELRKNGFSKENKSQQPQILIALLVSPEGFPIGYEVFSGNTFEGYTLIPVIKAFIKKHNVETFTVVADAAIISAKNIQALKDEKISFIVGARLANLPADVIEKVDQNLKREDACSIRVETEHGHLICSFSKKRYSKDKHEMTKQLEKAKTLLNQPSKVKRVKFISSTDQTMKINEKLVDKTTKLLGIKGYCTDIPESKYSNKEIINRYHDLYKIEQAFRISKTDLRTRPIFHFKEDPIKLHILVCFMALVISKHIELSTSISIRAFTDICKKVTDARLVNKVNGKELRKRVAIPEKLSLMITKLIRPH